MLIYQTVEFWCEASGLSGSIAEQPVCPIALYSQLELAGD
jgi:hypothetical protein